MLHVGHSDTRDQSLLSDYTGTDAEGTVEDH